MLNESCRRCLLVLLLSLSVTMNECKKNKNPSFRSQASVLASAGRPDNHSPVARDPAKELMVKYRAAQTNDADTIPPTLLDDCTEYTIRGAGNASLTCSDGLMARSGVKYLRSFIPDTSDKPGHASLRVLDSFSLTDSPQSCQFTGESDGRHFYYHDMLQLRVLAEGTLAVVGSAQGYPQGSGAATAAASLPAFEDDGVFLTSKTSATEYGRTMEIPTDLDKLLRLAFSRRHVTFIGDSTTICTHHQLAAWLLSSTSQNSADQSLREQIHSGNLTNSAQALTAMKKGCPEVKNNQFPKEFLGGRCAYVGTTFCKSNMGCTSVQRVKDEGVSDFRTTLSFVGGHGSLYPPDKTYALKQLAAVEKKVKSLLEKERAEAANNSSSTSPAAAAAAAAPAAELEPTKIVIVGGGLHYLHAFPMRSFEGKLGALLGDYQAKMKESLDVLRAHVGPRGLVVWKTVGVVCESKYTGEYKLAISRIERAIEQQNQERKRRKKTTT